MAAFSIVGELLMKTGSFETDTTRAAKSLQRLQKEAKATQAAFRASFAGNLLSDLAQQIGQTIAKIPGQVLESIDAFNDLKDATGASIENISAVDRVARETGVGFETVSTAIIKLNQALLSAKPDSPTGEALARIGLSFKELQALDPAEALRQVAVALSRFSDDGSKARLVQELFGKSLKEVAPLLNDLATKTELVAKTSTEGAAEIEKFRKELFQLEANSQDTQRALTVNLVTGINSVIAAVREGRVDIISFHKEMLKIATLAATFGIIDFRDRPNINYSNEGRNSYDRKEDYGNEGRNKRSVGDPNPKPDKKTKVTEKKPIEFDQHIKDYEDELRKLAAASFEAAQSYESFYQKQLQAVQGYEQDAKAAKEAADTYDFTRDQLQKLNVEKLLALATDRELLALDAEKREGGEALGRLYRDQAKALRDRAGAEDALRQKQNAFENDPLIGADKAVKDYLDSISKAGLATYDVVNSALHSFEDLAVNALLNGNIKSAAKSLVNQLIAEFYRLQVVRPLLNSIFGGASLASFFAGGNTTQSGPTGGFDFSGSGFPLASGTNYVPYDGFKATLHEGEAVVPKAYNPTAHGVNIKVENAPADHSISARQESDGEIVLTMQRIARAEVARASRPGGAIRQGLRAQPPDRS